MKAVLRLMGLLFAFLSVLPTAHAADLTGAWKGSFEVEGNTVAVTLNLTSSGNTVAGNVVGMPTSPAEIHDGKIDGDTVSFWVNSDYQGQTYKLIYKGKIAGDQIDFSFGTEDGNWGTTMTVKRDVLPVTPAPAAAPDVSGAWKGDFDFNGTVLPLVFHLKSTGGVLTGTVDGMGPAPIDIHDGKVDGDSVTFWLNADYQGQTYALNYKGKLTPGQIDFTFGTADGSWGASVTVKKS